MRLFSAIGAALSAEGLDVLRIRYTVIDGRGGYFQNVRRVLEISEGRILLAGRKGTVCVEGRGLSLGKCGDGDVSVLGEIFRVTKGEG